MKLHQKNNAPNASVERHRCEEACDAALFSITKLDLNTERLQLFVGRFVEEQVPTALPKWLRDYDENVTEGFATVEMALRMVNRYIETLPKKRNKDVSEFLKKTGQSLNMLRKRSIDLDKAVAGNTPMKTAIPAQNKRLPVYAISEAAKQHRQQYESDNGLVAVAMRKGTPKFDTAIVSGLEHLIGQVPALPQIQRTAATDEITSQLRHLLACLTKLKEYLDDLRESLKGRSRSGAGEPPAITLMRVQQQYYLKVGSKKKRVQPAHATFIRTLALTGASTIAGPQLTPLKKLFPNLFRRFLGDGTTGENQRKEFTTDILKNAFTERT